MTTTFLPYKSWVLAAPWVSLITNSATYYYGPGNNGFQPYRHILKIVKIQMSGDNTAARTGLGAVSTITLTVYKGTTSNAIMTCQQTFANDGGADGAWSVSSTTVLSAGYDIITTSDDLIVEIAQVANGTGGTLRNTYVSVAVEAEMID